MATEIYPMPMFPTLDVCDVAASTRWYQALGFEHVFTMPDASGHPVLAHLRWRRHADVLLRPAARPVDAGRDRGVSLTFTLTTDAVAEVVARARALGASILAEPAVRPWNVRDAAIADPDGHVLVFSYGPLDAGMTIEDVTERVRSA